MSLPHIGSGKCCCAHFKLYYKNNPFKYHHDIGTSPHSWDHKLNKDMSFSHIVLGQIMFENADFSSPSAGLQML
ncbi:hypothetical protein TUM4637_23620 [Shewanella hafniensis]|nr:hypothetical protein TUM4637_23620 [Shewanella hafniensis]